MFGWSKRTYKINVATIVSVKFDVAGQFAGNKISRDPEEGRMSRTMEEC